MFEPVLCVMSPLWAATNAVARTVMLPRAKKLPCPVISVGNIVAGGVGKTEVTAAIAARLLSQGRRVTVACRGYGSSWEDKGSVAHDFETAASLGFPDEALVLLKKAPGVCVAVGADRVGVLTRHWEDLKADVVVLDDGYQHFKIARDVDILVHDFNVRWPILRDFPVAFSRAQVRVTLSDLPKTISSSRWVHARYRLLGSCDAQGRNQALPREAVAFCGLGNPRRFKRALEEAGVKVRAFKALSDHARYDERTVRDIAAWGGAKGLPILTTLKDHVKLGAYIASQGGISGFEPLWVPIELQFRENAELLWNAVCEAGK